MCSQELHYAELPFNDNNQSGQPARQATPMDGTVYANVMVDGSLAPSSSPSPPSYEETLKRKREALQYAHSARDQRK